MHEFITLTIDGSRFMVRPTDIVTMRECRGYAEISFVDGVTYCVDQTYDEVIDLLNE